LSYAICAGRFKKLRAAFICWAKGYDEFPEERWRRQTHKEDFGNGIVVARKDIPDLLKDPDFIDAIGMWVDYKSFGSPVAGGFLEWPCQVYDIFKSFDSLYEKYRVKDG